MSEARERAEDAKWLDEIAHRWYAGDSQTLEQREMMVGEILETARGYAADVLKLEDEIKRLTNVTWWKDRAEAAEKEAARYQAQRDMVAVQGQKWHKERDTLLWLFLEGENDDEFRTERWNRWHDEAQAERDMLRWLLAEQTWRADALEDWICEVGKDV